ncbi:9119_t:CDS:2, partial [Cetraspora pellucida]
KNNELKKKKTIFLVKEVELMARIIELEQFAKKNAENSKLRDSELNELRSRVLKLEQKQLKNNIVYRLKDGDNSFENVNVPDFAINQCINTNTKLLEDKEMIDFLDEKNKKKVRVEINKISQITYNASAISSLKDIQIQNLINDFSKYSTDMISITNCHAHMTEPSQKNDQDGLKTRSSAFSELPEAKVNASIEETKSRVSDSSIFANSSE